MQVKVVIGTIAFMLTMMVLGFAALREPARLERASAAYQGRQIEAGALLYVNNCATCHGVEGKAEECYDAGGNQIACQGLPLNYAPLLCEDHPSPRTEVMGWIGTTDSYVLRTVAAGRGQVMPVWSSRYGGPMRDDQVRNVSEFVLNWQSEELCSAPPEPQYEWPEAAGDFFTDFPEGDPARGEELYSITYGCAACHGDAADTDHDGIGPWVGAAWDSAPRDADVDSKEQYVYESILYPNNYIVDGYNSGVMPGNFPQRMAETEDRPQDLADIMAYIQSLGSE